VRHLQNGSNTRATVVMAHEGGIRQREITVPVSFFPVSAAR